MLELSDDPRYEQRRTAFEQARTGRGIDRMDEIRYAVLERTGRIAIVPKRP